ncbi:hypothetical protein Tco_0127583 [Tanacetum coccineum]
MDTTNLREIILRRADYQATRSRKRIQKSSSKWILKIYSLLKYSEKLQLSSQYRQDESFTRHYNMWIRNQDRNDQRKLMRLNELHKFSDGTLTRVMEKLDQMVKDFHLFEYNKGEQWRQGRWSEVKQEKKAKNLITASRKD